MNSEPSRLRRRLLFSGATALALSMSHTALAEANPSTVTEVIVTAEKRSQNIQEVPQAVSAISNQLLSDIHASSLTDIGSYVPALQVDSGGTPGQTMISIRGIAPVGPGATVATYIDDTPVGSSSAYGGGVAFMLDLLPYDVERIEVLRGPQGTLYGASSMGGLVKYVLSTPSLTKFKTEVGADLFGMASSSSAGGGVRGLVSGPLIQDKLAATASFAFEDTPGFIDNPLLGKKDQNAYRQWSGRLGLLWQPTERLTVRLDALYNKIDADGDGTVALDGTTLRPIVGDRADDNLRDQPFRKDVQYYAGTLNYRFDWARLVSATSYTDTRTHQTIDETYIFGVAFPFFGLPAGTSQSQYQLHLKKFTQEVRLESLPGTKLEWLVGGFYDDEVSSNSQRPDARTLAGDVIPGVDPIFDAQLPSTYREYAVFGDLTYHLTDKLEVLGGVRYSENRQAFSEIATSALLGDVDLRNQKSHEDVVTYSAGVKYRFTDKVMAYGRIASGYQPGGPNLAIPGVPSTFSADTLTNYELGLKSQFLDNRVLLDVAGFYIDWNNIQLLANGSGISFGANGGTARSDGVEANLTLRPVDHLQLDGTFAYVDAVLTQDVPDIGGLKGDQLPFIPRYSGSVRASYNYPLSRGWRADFAAAVRMEGSRFSQVNSSPISRELPAYAAVDLSASLSNGRYTIRVFAKNVTDEHAYLTYNVLQNAATNTVSQIEAAVIQPRVVGIALDARF
jgi:outer membrane receptor protein involved in Fe transport